ncbi:hypothetical protein [Lihuaxuella thermophila]|uniref:hypothetical protein n=1 Tax=Lihuaxuella thermophila TaxID=1173111 RepID=UPI000B7CD1E5|nr:hypothetical protein [Lihuaxuella thermophila]
MSPSVWHELTLYVFILYLCYSLMVFFIGKQIYKKQREEDKAVTIRLGMVCLFLPLLGPLISWVTVLLTKRPLLRLQKQEDEEEWTFVHSFDTMLSWKETKERHGSDSFIHSLITGTLDKHK